MKKKISVALVGFWVSLQMTAAGAQVPDSAPDATMPGGAIIPKVIGWAKYGGLSVCAVFVVGGGALWAAGQHGGFGGGHEGAGKKMVYGGLLGAVLIAVAVAAVNGVFTAAK